MADVSKLQSTSGIFTYPDSTGSTGTTEDQYMEFARNHHKVLESTVHVALWQPSTDYKVGEVVASPNMVANTVARVSTAGYSGSAEPSWTKAGNSVADGTVTWLIVPRTLDFATDSELTEGTVANKIVSPKTLKAVMDAKLLPKLNADDLTPNLLYDVLHSKGENFVPTDVTNVGWSKLGTFISYYNESVLDNQPQQYGQLINICANKEVEATQIWIDQPSGRLAWRGGNGSSIMNDTPFTYAANASETGTVAGSIPSWDWWWVKLGGTIPLIIQGGNTWNGKPVTDSSAFAYVLNFPVAFPTCCMSVTGSPLQNSNDLYAYRTGHHILWRSQSQFAYAVGGEQQGNSFMWIAIGY